MITKDKPPDKYQCLKVHLQSILHNTTEYENSNKENLLILEDAITRTNNITTKTYLLLRLWILYNYHNQVEIPIITNDTISMCMKSLLLPSAGPKPKGNNLLLLNEFKNLHNNFFSLEDGKNLSAILDYYSTTMITCIENNIKMRFFDYIHRFIFSYYKFLHKEEFDNNKDFRKQLYKELNVVEKDILNNTLLCDAKYHNWVNENRYNIVPREYDTSYHYDIQATPHKYLKHMIFMCLELEKIERKAFQFFPIQSNAILRHIQIDTKALIELFIKEEKKQYLDNVELHKEFIWDKIFNVKQSLRKYKFDYTIITDGYSSSLRFLHKDFVEEQQEKKKRMKDGKLALKGLTKEEKDKIKETKKDEQKEKAKQKRLENKDKPKKSKKEEKIENPEFQYIDEIPKEELQGKHIFIDPGKRDLLTMMDDNGKFFSYTNKQYLKSTKRLKYQSLLKNYKDKIGITEIEQELNKYNSKSCSIEKFQEYITAKLEANKKLVPLYKNLKFRKYKWYSFINKKRTEDNIVNKIANEYSKEHKIIIGDWSIGKQMRNFISTPNLSLKRKLKEHFQLYNIDEFRTSCLSYKTEEVCDNLYLKFKKDPKQKLRKIHSILTYKMENKRIGCINRDKNGCKNIQKIFNSYIETGERPEKYRREYKIQ